MGFINKGGTLDVPGMLFVNQTTWAHVLDTAARLLGRGSGTLLSPEERAALAGERSPHGIIT